VLAAKDASYQSKLPLNGRGNIADLAHMDARLGKKSFQS
jgi:hypothetical protein